VQFFWWTRRLAPTVTPRMASVGVLRDKGDRVAAAELQGVLARSGQWTSGDVRDYVGVLARNGQWTSGDVRDYAGVLARDGQWTS
jgi:hypothetical protein